MNASISVFCTSWIVSVTNVVGSYVTFQARSSGNSPRRISHRLLDTTQRSQRVGARRLIDRDQRRGRSVQSCRTVKIGRTQFQAGDIAEAQDGPVRIRPDHDLLELGGRRQASLGLDVELQLLVVARSAGRRCGQPAPARSVT